MDIIFNFFLVVCAGIIFYGILSTFIQLHHIKQLKMKLPQLIRSFDTANSGVELGRKFVELMRVGFFQNLKESIKNNNFPDERQYQSFLRYATPEITRSLKEIDV